MVLAFKPVPGYDLKVLNSDGKEVGPGKWETLL